MKKTFRKFYGIDWKHCNDAVYRLQSAIAKAWQTNDFARVRNLQDTLVRSFAARALAVKKVRTNPGGKIPGVDGVVWDRDDHLMGAIAKLRDLSDYAPMPVKRVYIPKAKGGRRPLGIPTMYDRAVQTLFALALLPVAESTADSRSYAYRPYKSAHDAAMYLKLVLGATYSKRWVLEADIEKFFDTLSHAWLLEHIPMPRKILEKFLKAGFMESPRQTVHGTPMGTPQGGALSPIIANMALDGLQKALGEDFRGVRYADDLVVAGKSPDALTSEALPALKAFLAERGLALAERKTHLTRIEEGFDFLGFTFREYPDATRERGFKKGVFLITPAKANVRHFKKRLKCTLKALRNSAPRTVILRLNPILRGWAQYYKPFSSKKTFASVGKYVWELLWRWCCTKHPRKPRRALQRKYFMRVKGDHWVFFARDVGRPTITLVSLPRTKIVRHTLCADRNPFLPEHRAYYLRRQRLRVNRSVLLGTYRSTLLKKQKGICPMCQTELLDGQSLEVHHIHSRKRGGKDRPSNLLLMHTFCHKQLTHSKNIHLKAAWRDAGLVAE